MREINFHMDKEVRTRKEKLRSINNYTDKHYHAIHSVRFFSSTTLLKLPHNAF